ncbi:MAG: T9SS type A sorting domain-containing protein [Candidatus Delongbacteria bacterium]|nr:T9SS type A sorting domain-containing protein [Candidatus Delongbacteria bacterium]
MKYHTRQLLAGLMLIRLLSVTLTTADQAPDHRSNPDSRSIYQSSSRSAMTNTHPDLVPGSDCRNWLYPIVLDTLDAPFTAGIPGDSLINGDYRIHGAIRNQGIAPAFLPCNQPLFRILWNDRPALDYRLWNFNQPIPLNFHRPVPTGGFPQDSSRGYGIILDLDRYANPRLDRVCFNHSGFGVTASDPHQYRVHVLDMVQESILFTSQIQFTSDDQSQPVWDSLSLDALTCQGRIGVFIQPLSENSGTFSPFFPIISSDSGTIIPGVNYSIDLNNPFGLDACRDLAQPAGTAGNTPGVNLSGGNLMITLWIRADSIIHESPSVIQVMTIQNDSTLEAGVCLEGFMDKDWTLTAGSGTLVMEIDPNRVIPESDESNNIYRRALEIIDPSIPLTDLSADGSADQLNYPILLSQNRNSPADAIDQNGPNPGYYYPVSVIHNSGHQDIILPDNQLISRLTLDDTLIQETRYLNPDLPLGLNYHNHLPSSAFFQNQRSAYGACYDLSRYSRYSPVELTSVEFNHFGFEVLAGPYDYQLYVLDIENRAVLYTSPVLQAGDSQYQSRWEQIEFPAISTAGRLIGIFIRPLSGAQDDAYPILTTDSSIPCMAACNYIIDDIDHPFDGILDAHSAGNMGNFLINLWLKLGSPAGTGQSVKSSAPKLQSSSIQPSRMDIPKLRKPLRGIPVLSELSLNRNAIRQSGRILPIDSSLIVYSDEPVFIPEGSHQLSLRIDPEDLIPESDETNNYYQRPLSIIVGIDEPGDRIPNRDYLDQNYPNPFNPTTMVSFGLAHPGQVRLDIYSVLGEKIETILDHYMQAGYHRMELNAGTYGTGIYFCRLVTPENILVRKIMVIR